MILRGLLASLFILALGSMAFLAPLSVAASTVYLSVEVLDASGSNLPCQLVQVFRGQEPDQANLIFEGYSPLAQRPSVLTIPLSEDVLSGFATILVRTTNLTQCPNVDLAQAWQLRPQWLTKVSSIESIRSNPRVVLQWPAKLQLTIYAGDGVRYLENAWVFVVDAETNNNVTAALSDWSGHLGSIKLTDPALITLWQTDALATGEPRGTFLNLGFNLLPGKYIVKVFWKAPDAGAVTTFSKVEGVSVWDTFRDQPQHRYIYLGVDMPASATGEDNAPAQVRTFSTKVYDLKLKVVDQSPSARAITSAPVTITMPDASPAWVMHQTTSAAGEVTLNLVPAGKYQIVATSPVALYGKPASQITASVEGRVTDAPATILVPLPIFDATVTLVTPSGKPIVGADVTVGGVALGRTDAAGNALAASIPSGSYTVAAIWYGQDISPTVPLTVTLSRTYLLTASKIALVQIQVVGAQNQGLPQAAVSIKIGTTTVFTGMTNNDGVVAIELPYGTYEVKVSYKGVEKSKTISVTGETMEKIVMLSIVDFTLYVRVMDQSPYSRRIPGAVVVLTRTDVYPSQLIATGTTDSNGEVAFTSVPAGSYSIVATAPSYIVFYGKPAREITTTSSITVPGTTQHVDLLLPLYDVVIRLVTPRGVPIENAGVVVGGVALIATDAQGNTVVQQMSPGDYAVSAEWFGLDVTPTSPLSVTGSGTFTMTASKIARVQIQIVGALNQGLGGTYVTVKTGTTAVFSGIADSGGVVVVELPYGTYNVEASYKGVEAVETISVTGDTVEKIPIGIFIELLGQSLTFAGFLMWTVPVLVVLAASAFVLYRRRKATPPPPPPPT